MAMLRLRAATRQNQLPLYIYNEVLQKNTLYFTQTEREKGEKKSKMTTTSFISSPPPLLLRPHPLNRHLSSIVPNFQSQLPHAQVGIRNKSNANFRFMAMAAGGDSEKIGVPRSVPVRVAHELLQAGHRYLDVRTPEEFSAGHPSGAINVPYMFTAGEGMTKNPQFLEEVSKHFGKDAEIIVGCQRGKRSLMAAADLLYAGFSGITDVAGGYAAWTQNGLPTE